MSGPVALLLSEVKHLVSFIGDQLFDLTKTLDLRLCAGPCILEFSSQVVTVVGDNFVGQALLVADVASKLRHADVSAVILRIEDDPRHTDRWVEKLQQQLDPVGVASRDLKECLRLQAEVAGYQEGDTIMEIIVMRKQLVPLQKMIRVSFSRPWPEKSLKVVISYLSGIISISALSI